MPCRPPLPCSTASCPASTCCSSPSARSSPSIPWPPRPAWGWPGSPGGSSPWWCSSCPTASSPPSWARPGRAKAGVYVWVREGLGRRDRLAGGLALLDQQRLLDPCRLPRLRGDLPQHLLEGRVAGPRRRGGRDLAGGGHRHRPHLDDGGPGDRAPRGFQVGAERGGGGEGRDLPRPGRSSASSSSSRAARPRTTSPRTPSSPAGRTAWPSCPSFSTTPWASSS